METNYKNNYIMARSSGFSKREFYRVILDYYETNGKFDYNSSVNVDIEGFIKNTSLFNKIKGETKKKLIPVKVGVYAVKDEIGIREMVTGELLSIYGEPNSLYCLGIEELNEQELARAKEDLKFVDSDLKHRKQYIENLRLASDMSRKRWIGPKEENSVPRR